MEVQFLQLYSHLFTISYLAFSFEECLSKEYLPLRIRILFGEVKISPPGIRLLMRPGQGHGNNVSIQGSTADVL